jgi:hypothetical protein
VGLCPRRYGLYRRPLNHVHAAIVYALQRGLVRARCERVVMRAGEAPALAPLAREEVMWDAEAIARDAMAAPDGGV